MQQNEKKIALSPTHQYGIVTAAYWAFTLTDGALRMLVLLHFHTLGYSPLQLASLFLLYEIFGVITNIMGGWLGGRVGLNKTLNLGLMIQIIAVLSLSLLNSSWAPVMAVPFVIAVQGLSGIAKDFTKMSAKSALKSILPENQNTRLFRWVALLTGSKNTLKGVGFFMGGLMLNLMGFSLSLWVMAGLLGLIMVFTIIFLSHSLGRTKENVALKDIFSKSREINLLSLARLFLFGARDIWFVVALPLFLYDVAGFSFSEVGGLMALWVIGYGIVQSLTPMIIKKSSDGRSLEVRENKFWIFILTLLPFMIVIALKSEFSETYIILYGLALFGIVFAINSTLHSYLILAFTHDDHIALNVGFYYSANAVGRLIGTILSGLIYQMGGLLACLIGSGIMLSFALIFSLLISPKSKLKRSF
ncbi:MAG: organoarsenical effux MFS transporter ArsJ [Emcibacter sp.]|nr:organoarsenical effux MFS transporter ArsJ [Emcibacter sp.]